MPTRASAFRARSFLRVLVFPGEAFAKTGDLERNLHDTAWIEGVEALEGIEEMPHGSGVFFLEEFGIRGAAAFSDFLSDGCEELLSPLEYGIAAGVSRTGIAQHDAPLGVQDPQRRLV